MGDRAEWFRVAALRAKPEMSPGDLLLLEEACRLVDRSDRFDALIRGDINEWVCLEWPFEDQPARLVISSVVSEARQTVAELRQVVVRLNLPAGEERPAETGILKLLKGAG